MSDDYTPTTEEVREAYPHGSGILPPYYDMAFPTTLADRHAAFDRWLAKVKADALRELIESIETEQKRIVALPDAEKVWTGESQRAWSFGMSNAVRIVRARADRIEGKTDDN